VINQWAPPGVIVDYGGAAAPDGWLICDGSAISRTTYAALFTAIGTWWGTGDGTTTFNLPDLRGRMTSGYVPSGGHSDVSTVGNTDGGALGGRRPSHHHTYTAQVGSTRNAAGGSTVSGEDAVGGNSTSGGATVDAPAYAVVNKIIRAKDV